LVGADTFSAATAEYRAGSSANANVGNNKVIRLVDSSIAIKNSLGGDSKSNYDIRPVDSVGNITRRALTITAANDAKFNGEADSQSYQGVLYQGFAPGETASTPNIFSGNLVINRSNKGSDSTTDPIGSYNNVLVPSGLSAGNYAITYQAGSYRILANTDVLITANGSGVYGDNYSYQYTARYKDSNGNPATYIAGSTQTPLLVSSNSPLTIAIGQSVAETFTGQLTPLNASLSSSGNVNAGEFNITTAPNPIKGAAFGDVVVVGRLVIAPKVLSQPTLSSAAVTKVYDGSTVVNLQLAGQVGASSGMISGDNAQLVVTGSYDNKNVGANKSINVNFSLNGVDATNYLLPSQYRSAVIQGSITQLAEAVFVGGNSSNSWGNANNWLGGALPDLANVAKVIIPTAKTVSFNPTAVIVDPSTLVEVNGTLSIEGSGPTTLSHNVSGAGRIYLANSQTVTLSGNNTHSGGTDLSSGSHLLIDSINALGSGVVNSNNGSISILGGRVLNSINVTGSVTLNTDITTTGTQNYENIRLNPTGGNAVTGDLTLKTTANGDINVNGTMDVVAAKNQGIILNAGSGSIIIGDSVGSIARPSSLLVSARRIYILADILTSTTQTYNGSILIGNRTFIDKPFVQGFLFATHNQFFKYGSGAAASSYDYKDKDPRYVRTLISEDPMITFNGTVDDITDRTHTLLVAAIAPSAASIVNPSTTPTINFYQEVSSITPLYSLNAQAIIANTSESCASCLITLVDGVTTYGSQTYRAGVMTARASIRGGEVTFSVYDPNSSINFLLPLKNDASGQMNLLNPGTLDTLRTNGTTNFASAPNLTGADNWGKGYSQNTALNAPLPTNEQMNLTFLRPLIDDLRKQSELKQADTTLVGVVTIDDLEEGDAIDCAKPQPDQPLDPKCRPANNI
jgi:hypothetical protein